MSTRGETRAERRITTDVFWKWIDKRHEGQDGEAAADRYAMLRYYTVFNVAQCDGIALRTDTGEVLDATSGAEMKGSFGSSGYALTRAELLEALEGELGAEAVLLEARCTGFREDADGLVAVTADGTEHAADLVLGADGIRSTIRAQLFGETPLRYSGYAVWRGVSSN